MPHRYAHEATHEQGGNVNDELKELQAKREEFVRQMLILDAQASHLIQELEAVADKAAALHNQFADSIQKVRDWIDKAETADRI